MLSKILKLTCIVVILITITSCVAKRKFIAAENGRVDCIARETEIMMEREVLNKQLAALKMDTADLNSKIREYIHVLSSNLTKQEQLNVMLEGKTKELNDREKTINELQKVISKQQNMVNELIDKVNKALVNFNSNELTVQLKNGKVYVALSDNLLFKSGSADLGDKGKDALQKLAVVLKGQPDIDVVIEGHTDSIPIRTTRFKDNWDLSVLRATSIVRILTDEYEVNPKQLVPSGRAKYFPVATNETTEGRAANRRTEIILSPKLDELFDLLKKKSN